MHHPTMHHLTIAHLAATLHTLGARLTDRLNERIERQRHTSPTARPGRLSLVADRGSVTIEQVIWAVAVIAIVGIVVAAVKAYVTTQAGKIR
ncbi:hypothetical protein N864_16745 [Intrasporangium chromatireducens Q5-1]|uniref:Uncharacterized protein n=1 Tax=Intrasporangium chromatireducens Q5-1 TaxID=584657 RepID=W9GNX6_9MICO|nr:hypothetical protein [Intrasporangium chromatireducens]EWT06792.1 hypothetical protein N864_16745 [Intrasporangium chromatireducens Q5-1]